MPSRRRAAGNQAASSWESPCSANAAFDVPPAWRAQARARAGTRAAPTGIMPVARARSPRPRPEEVPGAEAFLPEKHTLPVLRAAVATCHGCPLYKDATQAVFGEGLASSQVMLIGEVPGDSEDLAGKPFIGPAGRLLDDALEAAGI